MRIFGVITWPLLLVAPLYLPRTSGHRGWNNSASEKTSEAAVRSFTADFYRWYTPVALRNNSVPAADLALARRPSDFGPILSRALKADSEAQSKVDGELVGIDFDPFLDSQDPCDHYEIGRVSQKGRSYRVAIYGICSGKRDDNPDVIAEVARQDGSWVFTNFLYPPLHTDLRAILKALQDERREFFRQRHR